MASLVSPVVAALIFVAIVPRGFDGGFQIGDGHCAFQTRVLVRFKGLLRAANDKSIGRSRSGLGMNAK